MSEFGDLHNVHSHMGNEVVALLSGGLVYLATELLFKQQQPPKDFFGQFLTTRKTCLLMHCSRTETTEDEL
jgi:hypothetical protein